MLEPLAGSHFIEVQERATAYLYFMKWLKTQSAEDGELKDDIIGAFSQVFDTELNPVRKKHQTVVAKKIPAGLDLDKWIGEPWADSSDDDDDV